MSLEKDNTLTRNATQSCFVQPNHVPHVIAFLPPNMSFVSLSSCYQQAWLKYTLIKLTWHTLYNGHDDDDT